MSQMTISEQLRRAIRESGVPLMKLERETGVQRMSLQRFVSGRQSLRLDKAEALCVYFGIECRQTKRKG